MKPTLNLSLLFRSICICLIFFIGQASGANLCDNRENIIFSCTFANKKSVAICKGGEKKSSYLEYRYGSPAKVEMTFRTYKVQAEKKFHRAEVVYASNASDVIWFNRGDVSYQIHLPARGGPLLEVLQDSRSINHQNCVGGWGGVVSDLDGASEFLINHGSGEIDAMERLWTSK